MRFLLVSSIVLVGLLSACNNTKQLTYLQGESAQVQVNEQFAEVVRIQKGDVLSISISSLNEDANSLFSPGAGGVEPGYAPNSFLVKEDGTINLPLVGAQQVVGLNLDEVEAMLHRELSAYLQQATINVRLVNFKITVLGEVQNPGVYEIPNARITLLEALGLAGDLTVYGRRDKITLVRQTPQGYSFQKFDISQRDSLAQVPVVLSNNDVIYVEPGRSRIASDNNIYRIVPLAVSTLTLVVLTFTLIQNQ